MSSRCCSVLLLALLPIGVCVSGEAARYNSPQPVIETPERAVSRADGLVLADSRVSMDQAVKMAEKKFKARVVKAESQSEDGKTVYVLRLLNESGRVWTVRVDASTGTVI